MQSQSILTIWGAIWLRYFLNNSIHFSGKWSHMVFLHKNNHFCLVSLFFVIEYVLYFFPWNLTNTMGWDTAKHPSFLEIRLYRKGLRFFLIFRTDWIDKRRLIFNYVNRKLPMNNTYSLVSIVSKAICFFKIFRNFFHENIYHF